MYYNRITDLGGRNEIGLKSRYIYLTSIKEKDFVCNYSAMPYISGIAE